MTTAILWFRRDLRLTDNPALQAALATCSRLLPVYIHAPDEESPWQPGAASHWWLDRSLRQLDQSLQRLGSGLIIQQGPSLETLHKLAGQYQATHLFWNRLNDPGTRARDTEIKAALQAQGTRCESHNAGLLFEPWRIQTAQQTPYRVFSAFWRACLKAGMPSAVPSPSPARLPPIPEPVESLSVDQLRLKPAIPWDAGLHEHWQPGEAGALLSLARFLDNAIIDYATGRDLPGIDGTSSLSPHLHFGEIGPRQVLQGIQARTELELTAKGGTGPAVYVRELGWREFAQHLLYHYPHTCEQPLDLRFQHFPWQSGDQCHAHLSAWQQGNTGIPIVDAGMRELWHTGWMHNRVRMIVASLLTKNLGIHWQEGVRWFWDTLVDADLANNTLGWQWTAGCGADAAPFFRIFNPVRQSERFDPQGHYLRRWLPELAGLPDAQLHAPWEARPEQLKSAGIELGKDYPLPIVDLKLSRRQALENWESIKTIPRNQATV